MSTRRGLYAKRRHAQLITRAHSRGVRITRVTREAVCGRLELPFTTTKYETARAITELLPELKPALPPKRKPWMAESNRMKVFEAAALTCAQDHANSGPTAYRALDG